MQHKAKQLVRRKIITPFQEFLQMEASGGILLIAAAVLAMVWANSSLGFLYTAIFDHTLTIGFDSFNLSKPLTHWINDGLMAVFFLVVGLEIKREVLEGELSGFKKAALPVAAALGGMIMPALLFLMLNGGTVYSPGWGIPMATDIAFAIGILSLLGNRVPFSLKILLTAFAIVDDLGAVLVIAFFYTESVSGAALAMAALALIILIAGSKKGVIAYAFYAVFGFVLWLALLKSGVHATIAGVLLALTIPARPKRTAHQLEQQLISAGSEIGKLQGSPAPGMHDALISVTKNVAAFSRESLSPMHALINALHPWVAFFIMPVFALANAGVKLDVHITEALGSTVALGVIAGLCVGKAAGITAFCWLAVKSGVAEYPKGSGISGIAAVAVLGGVGFTMAIFIANLAYPADPGAVALAKVGILTASAVSAVIGLLILRTVFPAAAR